MSPSRKREAARDLQAKFDVSERRACRAVDLCRGTLRYRSSPRSDEPSLCERMRSLARRWPRFGYRRVARLLRDEGWNASETRVLRLWRREGLKVLRKRRKKRGRGVSANACDRRPATKPNDVWAWDFTFDRTIAGSQLKWLSLIDEFTRECLVLKVDRSVTAEDLIDTLAEQFAMRGVPRAIRSDNGPEFAAKALRNWLAKLGLEPLYVAPGSPWQNGYAESFHNRLRDEFLSQEEFENLSAARELTRRWRRSYNEYRPHSSLGYDTPSQFANRWSASASTSAAPRSTLQRTSDLPQPVPS